MLHNGCQQPNHVHSSFYRHRKVVFRPRRLKRRHFDRKVRVRINQYKSLKGLRSTPVNSKFGNGLHVIPGFHTPYSRCQLATRAALLWLALLCHKGGNILGTLHNHIIVLLITFRLTIDFARPPIPSTTPFPWDVAKYF